MRHAAWTSTQWWCSFGFIAHEKPRDYTGEQLLGNILSYMHASLATHQTKVLEINCVIVLGVMTVMGNDSAVVRSGRLLLSCHHSLKH